MKRKGKERRGRREGGKEVTNKRTNGQNVVYMIYRPHKAFTKLAQSVHVEKM